MKLPEEERVEETIGEQISETPDERDEKSFQKHIEMNERKKRMGNDDKADGGEIQNNTVEMRG